MATEEAKKKRKAGKRSPGYPMLSLEESIQRAKLLWDKEKNNPIPLEVAYEHLGYKSIGGYGGRILAAMKHFDLISEKQGAILLTSNAVDLALHQLSDEKYIEIVKELALKPTIYEKLFNEYKGNLPSDATLKVILIKEYGFNADKVDGFLSDFRKTIEYANLQKSDREKSTKEHKMNINDGLSLKDDVSLLREREIAHYPIGQGLKARILVSGASPVTIDSIKKLMNLLEMNQDDLPEITNDKNEASEH